MATLRDLATELGYDDVATYVQSGNLVVSTTATRPAVEKAISKAIKQELSLDIDVMVRDRKQLAAVLEANPFAKEAEADGKSVHVSFLAGQPTAAAKRACDLEEFAPDRYAFGDRCLYLYFAHGSGRSKIASAPWVKRLGMPGTARNWRTVQTMLTMLDQPAG
jgi:uncharacterized protein (DUF1697 family)